VCAFEDEDEDGSEISGVGFVFASRLTRMHVLRRCDERGCDEY